MASKDINLVGAVFYGVPQVDLPINGGGTASFVEISDTTATAADVKVGTYFYTASGQRTEGTASGGSANIQELNVTQNGTYTASGGVDGYSPVIVNVSGGGDSWSWMGKNPVKVKSYTDKVYLKDTAYATWTPTTTSTKLSDATNVSEGYIGNRDNYDYVVYIKFHTHFEYGSGATGRSQITDCYISMQTDIYGLPTSYNNINAGTFNSVSASTAAAMRGGLFYYSSSGALTFYNSYSYGVFAYTTPTPSYDLSSATNIIPKVPQINAACNNTYFTTANAAAVDQDASYYEYVIEIWQVDRGTSNNGNAVATIRDMWLNGIS